MIDDHLQIDTYHIMVSNGEWNFVPLRKTKQCTKEEAEDSFADFYSN